MDLALWSVFIGVTLANACVFGLLYHSLFVRLNAVSTRTDSLDTKLPNSALMEIQTMFSGLKAEFDQTLMQNDSFRERVKKEIQRVDQVMRRNERAFKDRQEVNATEAEEDDESKYPDQVPLEQASMLSPDAGKMTKQQRLRAQWAANRGQTT